MKTTSSISNTFHPNHASNSLSTGLGSTSTLITDMFGDPYQFFLNLPFGESMAEQRRSGSFNNPYKFNGKELDSETGLYYYGARYYNPRISNWLSVDPIALWQPVQEIEHYIEGQHNGGYFNPKNMSVYGYTYQSTVIYVDPNGKQVDVTLPENPANMDMSIWENYTPERHTGHSQYWRHRETGVFLAYDKETNGGHYHLYENSKFKTRIDAEGIKSGTKLSNGVALRKGANRFHLKGGTKLNMSSISKGLRGTLGVFGTLGTFIDIYKILDGNPSALFSSFNPDGDLNTAYGISVDSSSLFSENLYYEIKYKNKDNSKIKVNFYNDFYYDHDSERYRGINKYGSATYELNRDGTYKATQVSDDRF